MPFFSRKKKERSYADGLHKNTMQLFATLCNTIITMSNTSEEKRKNTHHFFDTAAAEPQREKRARIFCAQPQFSAVARARARNSAEFVTYAHAQQLKKACFSSRSIEFAGITSVFLALAEAKIQ